MHGHGGRVYVDGANMNALVGLAAPGEFGGDVSHLNLHKTFCIPHGGGGPGVGPVCVVDDLVPFLPGHATGQRCRIAGRRGVGGAAGQRRRAADRVDVHPHDGRRRPHRGHRGRHPVGQLRRGAAGRRTTTSTSAARSPASSGGGVAHECILDLRPLKDSSGVSAEDVAKRLIDYGFHAPTLSFPVAGTLMVEPTESEPLVELDRFCDAMIAIRDEIRQVETGALAAGRQPAEERAAHGRVLLTADWPHPYPREQAAYPVPALKQQQVLERRSAAWTMSTATATCSAAACR